MAKGLLEYVKSHKNRMSPIKLRDLLDDALKKGVLDKDLLKVLPLWSDLDEAQSFWSHHPRSAIGGSVFFRQYEGSVASHVSYLGRIGEDC